MYPTPGPYHPTHSPVPVHANGPVPAPPYAPPTHGPGVAAERSLYQGRTHIKILFVPAVVQLLLTSVQVAVWRFLPQWVPADTERWVLLATHTVLLGLMVGYAVVPYLQWRASVFEVTTQRLRRRWGVLYKNSREIPLNRITQIEIERGILDRLVGCGTLLAYDASNSEPIRFHDVPRVQQVRRTIDMARHTTHQPLPHHATPNPFTTAVAPPADGS